MKKYKLHSYPTLISNFSNMHIFVTYFSSVQTMHEAGKCANVAREKKNYQLEILGISETRWTEAGKPS